MSLGMLGTGYVKLNEVVRGLFILGEIKQGLERFGDLLSGIVWLKMQGQLENKECCGKTAC